MRRMPQRMANRHADAQEGLERAARVVDEIRVEGHDAWFEEEEDC